MGGGNGSSSSQAEGIRRRVKSVDAAEAPMGSSRIARSYEQEAEVHKRTMSMARRPAGKGKGPAVMDVAPDLTAVPFSDEYDLCASIHIVVMALQSDNHIMQHMKARIPFRGAAAKG